MNSSTTGTQTNYSYDNLDRIVGKIQQPGFTWNNVRAPAQSVGYGYSVGGKLKQITLPSGKRIN